MTRQKKFTFFKNLTHLFLRIYVSRKNVLRNFKNSSKPFGADDPLEMNNHNKLFIKILNRDSYQHKDLPDTGGEVYNFFLRKMIKSYIHIRILIYLCSWVQSSRGAVESLKNDSQQDMIIMYEFMNMCPAVDLTLVNFLSLSFRGHYAA